MNGKIVLNLAISLDGFIADDEGSYGWILGHGDHDSDTEKQFDFYNDFLTDIDIVVMGKNCYDQGMHSDYADKKVYIATSKDLEDSGNLHFIRGDIVKVIQQEKEKGNCVYLFGGGILVDSFIKADAIDEYIIGIIPTILGGGRPLFMGGNAEVKLHLDQYFVSEGIVIMKYSRR